MVRAKQREIEMKCENCGHETPDLPFSLTAIVKLSKDAIKAIAAGADPNAAPVSAGVAGQSNNASARMLVDLYYTMQELRKATENQERSAVQGADPAAEVFRIRNRLQQTLHRSDDQLRRAGAAEVFQHP